MLVGKAHIDIYSLLLAIANAEVARSHFDIFTLIQPTLFKIYEPWLNGTVSKTIF